MISKNYSNFSLSEIRSVMYPCDLTKLDCYHQVLGSMTIGGAESLALDIHQYLVKKGFSSSRVFVPRGGQTACLVHEENFKYSEYNLQWLLRSGKMFTLFANLQFYLKMLPSHRGVIHIHELFVFGAMRKFLEHTPMKSILHIHLDYSEQALAWPLKRPPDLVLICADFMKPTVQRALEYSKRKPVKITVLRNAVDVTRYFPADRAAMKNKLGLDINRPFILMAAHLSPNKGQETAIRAVAAMRDAGVISNLWLVGEDRTGEGNYSRYLKDMIRQMEVGDVVQLTGFRTDVPDLMKAADFFVLPSISEGLPLSILEAQASKAIVVAAPTAGIPEVVQHGRTGFLIAAKDYASYARTMIDVWSNSGLTCRIATAAYEQILSHHRFDNYCDRILEEYNQLLL